MITIDKVITKDSDIDKFITKVGNSVADKIDKFEPKIELMDKKDTRLSTEKVFNIDAWEP